MSSNPEIDRSTDFSLVPWSKDAVKTNSAVPVIQESATVPPAKDAVTNQVKLPNMPIEFWDGIKTRHENTTVLLSQLKKYHGAVNYGVLKSLKAAVDKNLEDIDQFFQQYGFFEKDFHSSEEFEKKLLAIEGPRKTITIDKKICEFLQRKTGKDFPQTQEILNPIETAVDIAQHPFWFAHTSLIFAGLYARHRKTGSARKHLVESAENLIQGFSRLTALQP